LIEIILTKLLDGGLITRHNGGRSIDALLTFVKQNADKLPEPVKKAEKKSIPEIIKKEVKDVQTSGMPISPILIFTIFMVSMLGIFAYVHTHARADNLPIVVESGKGV
jgi:hypothetical protein